MENAQVWRICILYGYGIFIFLGRKLLLSF